MRHTSNNTYAQIDITLENGDKVMIVEVKSKPTTADITEPSNLCTFGTRFAGDYSPREW
jgi:hypothetical protein